VDNRLDGQVSRSAADVYEDFFVPALFREWAPRVAEAGGISAGQHVLDVACGTGVLAREAALRVGPSGAVAGLDRNQGMLAVARRVAPAIEWREGMAESLPFPDEKFDAVVSQFGLMFFEDRVAALMEMMRVLRPGGQLAIAVWDALDRTPGYAAMTALLRRLFGEEIADVLRAPFSLGDTDLLVSLAAMSALAESHIKREFGKARFPSITDWVRTDVKGWTLAELVDEDQYHVLLQEAERELATFVQSDGSVEFDAPALIMTACKPNSI
jgi:SAM-dependent methyltransferase